jgi:hypothetical protein
MNAEPALFMTVRRELEEKGASRRAWGGRVQSSSRQARSTARRIMSATVVDAPESVRWLDLSGEHARHTKLRLNRRVRSTRGGEVCGHRLVSS